MGTMARWYEERPRLVTGDFTHPSYTGAQQLGSKLVNAMMKGFEEYKKNGGACSAPIAQPAVDEKVEGEVPKSESKEQKAEDKERKAEGGKP